MVWRGGILVVATRNILVVGAGTAGLFRQHRRRASSVIIALDGQPTPDFDAIVVVSSKKGSGGDGADRSDHAGTCAATSAVSGVDDVISTRRTTGQPDGGHEPTCA